MPKVFFATSMDPFHLGHAETVEQLRRAFPEVVVGLGINPEKRDGYFSEEQRLYIARLSLPEDVEIVSYSGATLSMAQSIAATALGRGLRTGYDLEYEAGLQFQNEALGQELGFSIPTFYVLTTRYPLVSSTRVREFLRMRAGEAALRSFLHPAVIAWLLEEGYAALDKRTM